MSRDLENTGFRCETCGAQVLPLTNGSYRNHCPVCLYSKHVDELPGDRASECGGMMEPVELVYAPKKGYQIRHRCLLCGAEGLNRIAQETEQPDEPQALLHLSLSGRHAGRSRK